MAIASFITTKQKKQITIEKEIETKKGVTLDLSLEDAQILFALVGSVTGSDNSSARKYTTPIYYALKNTGLNLDGATLGQLTKAYFHCYLEDSSKEIIENKVKEYNKE